MHSSRTWMSHGRSPSRVTSAGANRSPTLCRSVMPRPRFGVSLHIVDDFRSFDPEDHAVSRLRVPFRYRVVSFTPPRG